MKISTRGRYGLKVMIDIASFGDSKCVSLKSISERHELSENYLEQLVSPLKRAGIIESVRGAGGGYKLCRAPEEITVGDILRVLEGSLAPAECQTGEGVSCGNNDCSVCEAKPVFDRLLESVNEVVDSVTLRNLLA